MTAMIAKEQPVAGHIASRQVIGRMAEQGRELAGSPTLEGFSGWVSDSGEGRRTLPTAVDEGVPAPVLSAAVFGRFSSRGQDDLANRVLSAMRQRFGGHDEMGDEMGEAW